MVTGILKAGFVQKAEEIMTNDHGTLTQHVLYTTHSHSMYSTPHTHTACTLHHTLTQHVLYTTHTHSMYSTPHTHTACTLHHIHTECVKNQGFFLKILITIT